MEQTPNPPTEESIFSEEEFSMEGYDKHIRNARIMLYIIAGLFLLAIFSVMPIDGEPARMIALGVLIVFAGIYIGLALWTKKKPYTAILTALILFLALQVINGILAPASLLQGWLIKILIIVMLILGLRNAKETQRMMETFGKKH